jgi:hypothetical protein|tara:strand:- start:252 stop:1208 length:957 start_codon:yes stop_codon:yes gene_type:complete
MSISAVETYFNSLIASASLPTFLGEFDGTHDIKRISNVKTIYKEDSCGVVPFRVTDRQSGNLSQAPLSASSYVLLGGEPNKDITEARRNPVYRILGGPLPTGSLVLHLVAEDLFPNYDHNASVTGGWTDRSSAGHILTADPIAEFPGTATGTKPIYRNDSPKEYSNVKFMGAQSYFAVEVADDHALATMTNKIVYIIFNAAANNGTSTPGNQFTVKTDASAQTTGALTVFAARNISGNIDIKKMTTYDTATDIKTGSEATGDDFGITADTVASDSLQNELMAEMYIYDFSSGTAHTDAEMKINMNRLFCKYLVTNPLS